MLLWLLLLKLGYVTIPRVLVHLGFWGKNRRGISSNIQGCEKGWKSKGLDRVDFRGV